MSKIIKFVRIAVPLALVAGIADIQDTIRFNRYISYHMYNTVLSLIVSHVDYAFLMVLAGFALWLAIKPRRSVGVVFGTVISLTLTIIIVSLCMRISGSYDYLSKLVQSLDPYIRAPRNMARFGVLLENAFIPIIIPLTAGLIFSKCYAARTKDEYPLKSDGINPPQWVRSLPNKLISLLIIAFVALHLLYGFSYAKTARILEDKPNVILIQVDTLRADHLGCYGYSRNTSPNIDRLAKQATRFTQAHAQAPWTLWSVTSYMTSQYPETLGIDKISKNDDSGFQQLNERYLTLAETLTDNGYSTMAISSNGFFSDEFNNSQGFDDYVSVPTLDPAATTSPAIVSAAKTWLDANKSKKFFMYLLFMDPHEGYVKHPEFDFSSKTYKGVLSSQCFVSIPGVTELLATHPEERQQAIDLYDSEIAYNDRSLGQLMDYLKSQDLYNNTMIVLVSDHGEGFGAHNVDNYPAFGHAISLYEALLRVPLIVKAPMQPRGRVRDGVLSLTDLFPSIVRSLGFNLPDGLSGRANDWNDPKPTVNEVIYSATNWGTKLPSGRGSQVRSIIRYPYKYILNIDSKEAELYNLATDPDEKHDIFKTEPGAALSLRTSLLEHEKAMIAGSNQKLEKAPLTEDQKQTLRGLGYLQ